MYILKLHWMGNAVWKDVLFLTHLAVVTNSLPCGKHCFWNSEMLLWDWLHIWHGHRDIIRITSQREVSRMENSLQRNQTWHLHRCCWYVSQYISMSYRVTDGGLLKVAITSSHDQSMEDSSHVFFFSFVL